MLRISPWPSSAPTKRCKTFFKRKRWCVEHCSDDASVASMAAEKDILCVLFEEFSKPVEIGINACLILQNTLDVTVTALAVQNRREHPNRVNMGFVETVVPNYCDPTFASHFRMKRQTFQMKDNPLLTSETVIVYMTLLFLLWVLDLLLLITVVVLWYCNIYYYIIRGA